MTDDDDSDEPALPLAPPLFCATSIDDVEVFGGSRGVEFVLSRLLASLLLDKGADVGIIVLLFSSASVVLLMLISSVVKSYKYTKKYK